MWRKRSDPHSSPQTPRWAYVLLAVFIGYVALSTLRQSSSLVPPGAKHAPTLGEGLSKLPTAYTNLTTFQMRELKPGQGEGAVCGQTVKVHYRVREPNGKLFYETPQGMADTVTLGQNKVIKALEIGLFGAQPGAERVITAPPLLAYDAPGAANPGYPRQTPVRIHAIVDVVEPPLPSSPMGLRVFDQRPGAGRPAVCGGRATVQLQVWRVDGTPVFASGPVTGDIVLGGGAPYPVEVAAIGMLEGASRAVIAPPQLAAAWAGKPNGPWKSLPLPPGQLVVMDVAVLKLAPPASPPTATPPKP